MENPTPEQIKLITSEDLIDKELEDKTEADDKNLTGDNQETSVNNIPEGENAETNPEEEKENPIDKNSTDENNEAPVDNVPEDETTKDDVTE